MIEICHQKLQRDKYLSEGMPDVDLTLRLAKIHRVSYQFAKQIILKYEWLGRMSATKHHYGLFFGGNDVMLGECAGVVCIGGFNCTGGSYTHMPFGIEKSELGVFARGANVHWSPPHANSKLVAAASRMVAQDSSYKILIAYADPAAAEIGTIYQACNWQYIGMTKMITWRMVHPDGRSFESAKITVVAQRNGLQWKVQRDKYLEEGYQVVTGNRKHRYVYILHPRRDRDLVARVAAMQLPYPKRSL